MNKEQQKQLITEIMDLDAKDGLYDTVNELDKLAEETFKGDDATTFVQREIWKDGYKKAQETLYTEEQVRMAIEHTLTLVGDNWSDIRFCLKADKFTPIRKPIEEFIQSLKLTKK